MPSFIVTGASRGLGYAFLKLLASDTANIVIGIVRNKASTEKKLAEDKIQNVHIFEADIVDLPALKASIDGIERVVDHIDYLICNAAYISETTALKTFGDMVETPDLVEHELLQSFRVNVNGLVNSINAYLPLILKSSIKKVIAISSGMGDLEFINSTELATGAPYAISKAAANMVIAKYNAEYKAEGILYMSICPGSMKTDGQVVNNPTEREMQNLNAMFRKIATYSPSFTGPSPPEDSAESVMRVAYPASLENGSGGVFVSHMGNKRWL